MCQGDVRPISVPSHVKCKTSITWTEHAFRLTFKSIGKLKTLRTNRQRDCWKYKMLLTTFSSGTDRLNVHSWLLTKESKKKKTKQKLSQAALKGNPSVCVPFDPSYR